MQIGRASWRERGERCVGAWSPDVSSSDLSLTLARKIKSLGGEPQFYDMDEPLFFGHFYDKENADRKSVVEGKRGEMRGCLESRRVLFRSVPNACSQDQVARRRASVLRHGRTPLLRPLLR